MILLTIITILSFVAFGRDLIARKSPIVYTANTVSLTKSLNKNYFKSFKAAIALTYPGGVQIPDIERMVDLN